MPSQGILYIASGRGVVNMMNKSGFIISLGLLVSTLTTVQANASVTVNVGGDGESVNIKGIIASANENIPIGIDVFAPDKDYDDLLVTERENVLKVLPFRTEIKSGEGGQWELDLKIKDNPEIEGDARSGNYTVIVYPQDAQEPEMQTFLFTNPNEMKENYRKIAEAVSAAEIKAILDNNVHGVGVSYGFYGELDKKNIAEMLYKYKTNNTFNPEDVGGSGDVLRKAAVIQAVAEGKIDNMFDYDVQLKLDLSELSELYKKNYATALYKVITEDLKGIDVSVFNDFYEELYRSFVLCVTENPDGVGNAKEVIDEFADRIGIKPSSKLDVYRKIMGKKYSSYEALKAAFEDASESGGSSGGGGGGSSSGGALTDGKNNSGSVGNSALRPAASDKIDKETMPIDIFTDIDNVIWAKEAIVYLTEKDIISGKADGLFYPNDNITREEFVKIAVLSFMPESEMGEIVFEDVDMNEWYVEYIAKAYNAGIISGYSEDVFGVGNTITREDIAVILYRIAKQQGIIGEDVISTSFEDHNDISDYAKIAVATLVDNGIINGRDDGMFAPKSPATRAETAKMVYRLLML